MNQPTMPASSPELTSDSGPSPTVKQNSSFSSTPAKSQSNSAVPPQKPESRTPSNKKLFPIFTVFLLITISILSITLFFQRQMDQEVADIQPTMTASPTVPSATEIPAVKVYHSSFPLDNIVDSQKRLLFLRNPDRDKFTNIQAWLMLPDGSQTEKLNLTNVGSAYKQPNSSLVFYTTYDDPNTIFVKNLNTNQVTSIKPLVHPNPEVDIGLSLQDLRAISPDGKYFIFSTQFTVPCPVSEVDSTEMGGSGPCQPEVDPNLPEGSYLYDLAQQMRIPLPMNVVRVVTWDMDNQKLYVVNNAFQNNGLEEIDLQTKKIVRFDNADSFGYSAFPLTKSNKLVRYTGITSDASNGASVSKFTVIDQTSNIETTIDVGRWAEIQPFTAISPDEKYVLYERSSDSSNNRMLYSIYRYNLQTAEKQKITPETSDESYRVGGVWVDDNTLITKVDTVKEPYHNGNNFLVKIDVPTGQITRLTPNDDVYRFTGW